MDTDVSAVGKYCQYCSALDFLPITCHFCQQHFCNQHIQSSSHHCPALSLSSDIPSESGPTNGQDILQDLLPASDRHLRHTEQPELDKNAAAKILLRKNFTSTSQQHKILQKSTGNTKRPLPKDPKLRLMVLKQRALPINSSTKSSSPIPVGERIYFRFTERTDDASAGTERELYTSRSILVGRLLDLLYSSTGTEKMKLYGRNSTAGSKVIALEPSMTPLSDFNLTDDCEIWAQAQ